MKVLKLITQHPNLHYNKIILSLIFLFDLPEFYFGNPYRSIPYIKSLVDKANHSSSNKRKPLRYKEANEGFLRECRFAAAIQ